MGKQNEIKHRIWRSQTNLVMPIIDELRIKIFAMTKNQLGKYWNHEEIPEVGELKFCFDRLPADSPHRRNYFEIIRQARDVRNKLAHMDIITFREYEFLWKSWQKIRQQIS